LTINNLTLFIGQSNWEYKIRYWNKLDLVKRVKEAYNVGGSSALELIDAFRSYREFEKKKIQAYYNYLSSYHIAKVMAESYD